MGVRSMDRGESKPLSAREEKTKLVERKNRIQIQLSGYTKAQVAAKKQEVIETYGHPRWIAEWPAIEAELDAERSDLVNELTMIEQNIVRLNNQIREENSENEGKGTGEQICVLRSILETLQSIEKFLKTNISDSR
jgi:hypothetical protein